MNADNPELLRDPRVCALAMMFLIEDLKTLALAEFQDRLDSSYAFTLCSSVDFAACVRETYAITTQSSSMRSAVVKFAAGRRVLLRDKKVFLDPLYKGLDFVVDLFRAG